MGYRGGSSTLSPPPQSVATVEDCAHGGFLSEELTRLEGAATPEPASMRPLLRYERQWADE